jgi:hypothetical protein
MTLEDGATTIAEHAVSRCRASRADPPVRARGHRPAPHQALRRAADPRDGIRSLHDAKPRTEARELATIAGGGALLMDLNRGTQSQRREQKCVSNRWHQELHIRRRQRNARLHGVQVHRGNAQRQGKRAVHGIRSQHRNDRGVPIERLWQSVGTHEEDRAGDMKEGRVENFLRCDRCR